MSRFDNYNFDRYDDFGDEALDYALSKITIGDSCYCKTMMICSYCMKGYN